MEMLCLIPRDLQRSLVKLLVNQASWLDMTLLGSPTLGNTLSINRFTTSSMVIDSEQGKKIATFVQSWSVMVRIESWTTPSLSVEWGSFTMKSRAMVLKGVASGCGFIG